MAGSGATRSAPTEALDPATAAELRRAAERAALCSVNNATGTGLRGEYFARGSTGETPLLTRVDATIDFDRSLDWPIERVAQRPSVARWAGWVRPSFTGRYAFHVENPGAQVTIARQSVNGHQPIELFAGRYYPIAVEVAQLDHLSGRLQLEWTVPFGARYVVPRALLFVPSERVGVSRP